VSAIAYRRDIDGLRALAVLSIILFHAGLTWCPGGYLGVDVFFVISGFLITRIMLRENASGSFTLRRFYERRARRILPALFVMLFAAAAVAYLLQPPMEFRAFSQSLTAVLLFSSNILFWQRAGSFDFYFEPSAQLNPLLHTWSLGVEEQFYLLFPVCVALAWRAGRRWVFPLVALVAVASFVCGTLFDTGHVVSAREASFYLLPARAWQLMLGGLIAFRSAPEPGDAATPRMWRHAISLVALALIVVPILTYRPYEIGLTNAYALAPTGGTALLLAAGPQTAAAAVLSLPVLVGVGLISYSAYLWHQPLFAFAHAVSLEYEFSLTKTLVLCAITLVLAWASWRWVETPFRDRRKVSLRKLIAVCGAATGVLLVPALAFSLKPDLPTRGRLLPGGLVQTSRDRVQVMAACGFTAASAATPGCLLNRTTSATPAFMVLGDSHAAAMLPAFERLSERLGWQGRLVALAGCQPLLGQLYHHQSVNCARMQEAALDYSRRANIARVFLVSRWAAYTDLTPEISRPLFIRGVERTVDAYRSHATLYIVEQVPQQNYRPSGIYTHALLRRDAGAYIRSVSVTRAEHEARQAFVTSVFARYRSDDRIRFIDPATVMCDGGICPVGTENQSFYWDDSHLSVAGALFVTRALEGDVKQWHW
jgi:peptidoglycan/LPS O-acetylase OafA/YrhL